MSNHKIAIEQGEDGIAITLDGKTSDLLLLWCALGAKISDVTDTPLPALCAACAETYPMLDKLVNGDHTMAIDMSAINDFMGGGRTP